MTNDPQKRSSRQPTGHGFTLVEVLFGVVMVSVIMAGVLVFFQSAMMNYRLSSETTESTLAAQAWMEYLMSRPYGSADLNAGTTTVYLNRRIRRTTVITNDSPLTGAKKISVTARRGTASSVSTRYIELIAIRPGS